MKISQFSLLFLLAPFMSLGTTSCASKPPIDSQPVPVKPPPTAISTRTTTTSTENSDRTQVLKPRCVKWADFKQAVKDKRISLDTPIPELPSNFREGCLLADRGIHTLVIYVFANDTDVKRLPINTKLPSLYRDFYTIIPPVKSVFATSGLSGLNVDRQLKYMRIALDKSNWSNKLALNKPQRWKTWEHPYVDAPDLIFYQNIFVEGKFSNQKEIVDLLEATKDRWESSASTADISRVDDSLTCRLKNWNLANPSGEARFTIAVTNRSKKLQRIVLIELEILDKQGNHLRTLSNPYRRYQGYDFSVEPPIHNGETRELEGFRKNMVGWHEVKLKRCQWLESPEQYYQIYPELHNIYLP